MDFKFLKLLFTIVLITNITFGQTKTPFLINDELFELTGKWELLGKIEKSGQYSFSNKKLKIGLLISVRKEENFEFYSKDLTEIAFLNKYYTWETEYWAKEDKNIEIEKIEIDEVDKFIVWRLKIIDKNIENFKLSGVKNNKLIGISLSDKDKIEPKSIIEIIKLLKNVYFNK